ncbi:hypothetical protein [Cribrihabitans marinus]|nr:hypothetical protein [Cribrihabitans marinus]
MPAPRKIATCCYCGTRAALVLAGDTRHELSCAACGAPLRNLKMLPDRNSGRTQPGRPKPSAPPPARKKKPKYRKPKKRKSVLVRFLDEAWDVVEDIFD